MKTSEVFTCPKCGGHTLEEVLPHVVQISVVTDVEETDSGVACDYDTKSVVYDGGEDPTYQCGSCNAIVAENETELLELLFPDKPRPNYTEFLQRINRGYYDHTDNGIAQFKQEVLDHYGWQHEDNFRQSMEFWRQATEPHGQGLPLTYRDRLIRVLDDLLKLI